jgi:hypothetical protein
MRRFQYLAVSVVAAAAVAFAALAALSRPTAFAAPPAPSPVLLGESGQSVSCPTASFCIALGDGSAVTFNGRSWSRPKNLHTFQGLQSVSCPSSSFCAAVGAGQGITFNGRDWSKPSNIDVNSNNTNNNLYAVSWADSIDRRNT